MSAGGPASPVAVVTAYLDALNDHDPDEASRWVADDFFNEHVSVRGTSFRGRREYRRRVEAFLRDMVDLHYDVERMVATGDTVVVAYRMSAQWSYEGGGRPFTIRGVFWFEVLGGRIAHRVDYRDGVDFEQQVGLR